MSNPATTAQTGARHLTDADMQQVLNEAGGKPVFVDFFAEWCGPCKLAAPIVDKLADEYADKVIIAKLDVDENPDTARQYGVMSIPTVIVFQKQGDSITELDRKIGFPGEPGYRQMLDKVVGADKGAAKAA